MKTNCISLCSASSSSLGGGYIKRSLKKKKDFQHQILWMDQWDNIKAWKAFDQWERTKQRVILPPPSCYVTVVFLFCSGVCKPLYPQIKVPRVPLWFHFCPGGKKQPASTVEGGLGSRSGQQTNHKHTPPLPNTQDAPLCIDPAAALFTVSGELLMCDDNNRWQVMEGGRDGGQQLTFLCGRSLSVGLGAPRPAPGAPVMDRYSWDRPGWGKLI